MYIYSPLSLASSLESRARRRVNGIARLEGRLWRWHAAVGRKGAGLQYIKKL